MRFLYKLVTDKILNQFPLGTLPDDICLATGLSGYLWSLLRLEGAFRANVGGNHTLACRGVLRDKICELVCMFKNKYCSNKAITVVSE